MSSPNETPNRYPNENPNTQFNPDNMSYTNLMLFGTPNNPGSSSSTPIRNPNFPPYGMYPPYYPQPFEYGQQPQQPYPFFPPQQNFFPPQQPFFQPHQQPEQQTQQSVPQSPHRSGKQPQQSPNKRTHKKRVESGPKICNKKNWSGQEEAWLATCWCDTSEDSVTGNNQKRGTLWSTVEEKFNANSEGWIRNADALSSKWRYINTYCKNFNAIYESQSRAWRSGNDDDMVYKRSLAEYFQMYNKSFNMQQAWDVVRFHPKWRAPPGVQHEDTDNVFTESVDLSDDHPTGLPNELFQDDPYPRPMGRNKARKAARSSGSSDAATSSRSGTPKSKMENIVEELASYKSEMFRAKKKAVDTFTRNENLRTAMQGVTFLSLDTSHMDAATLRVHNKMKKKIMRQFREFYENDDDAEGDDEGGEQGDDQDSDDE